jgi:hypothetical protein
MPNAPLPTGNALIPTSGERLSTGRPSSSTMHNDMHSKRPRLAPSLTPDRFPQEDMGPPTHTSRGARYSYHSTSAPPSFQLPAYVPGLAGQQSFTSGNSFDFPSSRGQFRPVTGPIRTLPPYSQHSDTRHLMRLTSQQYPQQLQHTHAPMANSHQQQQPHHPGDIFATFLEGDQRQQGSGFSPIDWPVHASTQAGRSEQGMFLTLRVLWSLL